MPDDEAMMAGRGTATGFECLWCDYDLTAAGESGKCPECGRWYDKGRDGEWVRRVLVRLLWCIGVGAMLVYLAPVILDFVPPLESGSRVTRNTALLSLLPRLVLAASVVLGSVMTGKGTLGRAWPAVIAGVYAVIETVVYRGSAFQATQDTAAYGGMLTPTWWATQASWVRGYVACGTAIAAAAVVRRTVAGAPVLRIAAVVVFWMAVAGLAAQIAVAVQQSMVVWVGWKNSGATRNNPFGGTSVPDGPLPIYFRSGAFGAVLRWMQTSLAMLIWVGVGFLSMVGAGLVGQGPAGSRRS